MPLVDGLIDTSEGLMHITPGVLRRVADELEQTDVSSCILEDVITGDVSTFEFSLYDPSEVD